MKAHHSPRSSPSPDRKQQTTTLLSRPCNLPVISQYQPRVFMEENTGGKSLDTKTSSTGKTEKNTRDKLTRGKMTLKRGSNIHTNINPYTVKRLGNLPNHGAANKRTIHLGIHKKEQLQKQVASEMNGKKSKKSRLLGKVEGIKLYLIDHILPNSFVVSNGESQMNQYKIVLGPQSCTCGQLSCVHLMYFMVRVLKLPDTDKRIVAKTLSESDTSALLNRFYNTGKNKSELPPCCPICNMDLAEGESVSYCSQAGCSSVIHVQCQEVWSAHKTHQNPPGCPRCQLARLNKMRHKMNSSPTAAASSSPGYDTWSSVEDLECGGFVEDIPLPSQVEPMADRHSQVPSSQWNSALGREMVACLFSKDWCLRETALKRLAREVANVLNKSVGADGQDQSDCSNGRKFWKSVAEVLARAVNDKVYKVYIASLKCLQTFLVFTSMEESQVPVIKASIKPVIQSIMSRCMDGNKRISEVSLEAIIEFCKGSEGRLGLGIYSSPRSNPEHQGYQDLLNIDLVLQYILEDHNSKTWHSTMGRLVALEHILTQFGHYFQMIPNQGIPLQESSQYFRTMIVVDFSFKHLSSIHFNIRQSSRNVFVTAAKMTLADLPTYHQILDLLHTLDPSLQLRMKKRLLISTAEHQEGFLLTDKVVVPGSSCTPSSVRGRGQFRMNRSLSHSPSRCHTFGERCSSQSPMRMMPGGQNGIRGVGSIEQLSTKKQKRLVNPTSTTNCSPSSAFSAATRSPLFEDMHNIQEEYFWDPYNPTGSSNPMMASYSSSPSLIMDHEEDQLKANELVHLSSSLERSLQFQTPMPVIDRLLSSNYPELGPDSLETEYENQNDCSYQEGRDWQRGILLGSGAYSTCYQARDVKTGTLMAVKKIHNLASTAEEANQIEALMKMEVDILRRLKHPHVIRMFGATKDGNGLNMFVEWMAGGSVSSLLDKHGPFHEVLIRRFIFQTLLGLDYLHHCGILHRDIKGANLLVDSSGQHLRIADFGTAAQMASRSSITGEFRGQLQGTIAFMAPEVLRGENYGRSCDIWSLGCCVIEMSTAKPPWNAPDLSNHLALIFKIACCSFPPDIPQSLSPGLVELTSNCLLRVPSQRPTARQLLFHPIYTHTT